MKTAVEWLVNEMPVIDWQDPYWKIKLDKAKEMEKQEQQKLGIILAAVAEEIGDKKFVELLIEAKQYYNKTYGKNNIRV